MAADPNSPLPEGWPAWLVAAASTLTAAAAAVRSMQAARRQKQRSAVDDAFRLVSGLQDEMGRMAARLAALEKRNDELEGENTKLWNENRELRGEIGQLKRRMRSAEGDFHVNE